MSTEKGELIGITEKELFKLGASLPYNDGIRRIALAAQRALAKELIQRSNEWDIDQPISSMMIPVVVWDELCAKLGVTK